LSDQKFLSRYLGVLLSDMHNNPKNCTALGKIYIPQMSESCGGLVRFILIVLSVVLAFSVLAIAAKPDFVDAVVKPSKTVLLNVGTVQVYSSVIFNISVSAL